jgi:hypothetical protein
MAETVPFWSADYLVFLALLVFSRGMDFLSTWVATPHLVLEGNPIAKWLGWKWGALINLAICIFCATLPLPTVVVVTTSLLVAARNFQGAWLMRTLGEYNYRHWMSAQLAIGSRRLLILCLVAQTTLIAIIGAGLVWFGGDLLVPTGVGLGLLVYAFAVLLYSLLSLARRSFRGK